MHLNLLGLLFSKEEARLSAQELLKDMNLFRSPGTSYQESQQHSRRIDELFGLSIENTESSIDHSQFHGLESWQHLSQDQLQTPYDELLSMTEFLQMKDGEQIIDLGAGYGRLGLVLAQQCPEVNFLGLELVEERVVTGNQLFKRLNLNQCELRTQDLLADDYELPQAEVYFLYDFGQKQHLKILLDRLEAQAQRQPFRLIARGRGVRSLIHHGYPMFFSFHNPHHFETYSVYSTP